jgi:hypothetical protein
MEPRTQYKEEIVVIVHTHRYHDMDGVCLLITDHEKPGNCQGTATHPVLWLCSKIARSEPASRIGMTWQQRLVFVTAPGLASSLTLVGMFLTDARGGSGLRFPALFS